MNSKPKIQIEAYRSFGDFIGDAFKFVLRNRKHFLQGLFIYVFPLFFLGSIALYFFSGNAMDFAFDPMGNSDPMDSIASMGIGMGVYYLVTFFTYFALILVTYSIVLAYRDSEDGEMDFAEVQKYIKAKFAGLLGTYLLVVLSFVLFMTALFSLGFITSSVTIAFPILIGIASFFILVWLTVIVQFPFIINMDKGLGPVASIRKAFEIIKGEWWNTFLFMFVMSLLVGMIAYIFILPVYILMIVKMVAAIDDGGSSGMGVLGSLYMISILLGTIVSSTFYMTGMALKYFSIIEKKEGGSLRRKIILLGQKEESLFENEGDF